MLMNELSQPLNLVTDDLTPHFSHRTLLYVRKDYKLTRAVYRAQAIRRLAGERAARAFLNSMGVGALVTERVISSSLADLRR